MLSKRKGDGNKEKAKKVVNINRNWYGPSILLTIGIVVYTIYWITHSLVLVEIWELF